jgi:hypothetical protein
MNILKALGKGLNTINPIRVGESLMANAIKLALLSALKGLAATLLAALAAFSTTTPAAADAVTVMIWGLVINGVHALITLLQHIVNPAPVVPPKV